MLRLQSCQLAGQRVVVPAQGSARKWRAVGGGRLAVLAGRGRHSCSPVQHAAPAPCQAGSAPASQQRELVTLRGTCKACAALVTRVSQPVPHLHLALNMHHPLLRKNWQACLPGRTGLTPLMSMTPVRDTASRRQTTQVSAQDAAGQ